MDELFPMQRAGREELPIFRVYFLEPCLTNYTLSLWNRAVRKPHSRWVFLFIDPENTLRGRSCVWPGIIEMKNSSGLFNNEVGPRPIRGYAPRDMILGKV